MPLCLHNASRGLSATAETLVFVAAINPIFSHLWFFKLSYLITEISMHAE